MLYFLDESRFDSSNLTPNFVRRPLGERFNEKYISFVSNRSISHVIVWGAFSKFGHTKLVRIEKTIKAIDYCNMLSENLILNFNNLLPKVGYFQQDNCPIHTAKYSIFLKSLMFK